MWFSDVEGGITHDPLAQEGDTVVFAASDIGFPHSKSPAGSHTRQKDS